MPKRKKTEKDRKIIGAAPAAGSVAALNAAVDAATPGAEPDTASLTPTLPQGGREKEPSGTAIPTPGAPMADVEPPAYGGRPARPAPPPEDLEEAAAANLIKDPRLRALAVLGASDAQGLRRVARQVYADSHGRTKELARAIVEGVREAAKILGGA